MTADTFDTSTYVNAGNLFSNSNRSVALAGPSVISGGIFSMAQLTEGKKAGKFYIEITNNSLGGPGTDTSVGVTNSFGQGNGQAFGNFWGGNDGTSSVRYDNGGPCYFQHVLGPPEFNLPAWGAGDVIGMALDMDTPNLAFNVNGGVYYNITGAMTRLLTNNCRIFPCVGCTFSGAAFKVNTGQIAFNNSPPAGFTGGWPNTTAGTYFGSMATSGQGTTQRFTNTGTVAVSPYIANAIGHIASVVIGAVGTWTINAVCCIYADSAGSPGALVGSTSAVSGSTAGELTYTFSPPVSVVNGTQYWIGLEVGTETGGNTYFLNKPLNSSGPSSVYTAAVTFPTPNNPFGSPSTINSILPLLMYPGAGPAPGGGVTSFGQII